MIGLPAHKVVGEAVAVTPVGVAFTVTVKVCSAELIHPFTLATVIVPVYVPEFAFAGTLIVIFPPPAVPEKLSLVTAVKLLVGEADQMMLYEVGKLVVAV